MRVLLAGALLAGCAAAEPVAGSRFGLGELDGRDEPSTLAPSRATSPTGLLRGVLSGPADGPVEAHVRRWLEGRGFGGAEVRSSRPAGAGRLVRLQQRHAGLDVVGGDVAVRTDAEGRVRWASIRWVAVPAALSTDPRLGGREALVRATGSEAGAAPLPVERHARLVVYGAPGARPRLAWHVAFSDELSRRSERVYVDATDGVVIAREDRVRRNGPRSARVYDVSPVDSELEEVELSSLPDGATVLADDDLEVLNCVDERRCHEVRTSMGVRSVHHCEMVPLAVADPDDGFLGYAPPEDHAEPEDAFAEVQAYHHLRSGMTAFRGWARDESFAMQNHLTTVVNMRVPDLSTAASECDAAGDRAPRGSELMIEENAYFWPAGEIGPTELGDRVVLHQTALTDWAYDGEVVWHELTHAVMHTTTPLAFRTHDELGVDYAGGGLHEAFADYFAAAISNRPTLSWYGGTTADGPAPMNDLDKLVRCGDVLTGEEHEESVPFVGALWAIRRSLRSAAKRDMMDAAMFTVIGALGQHDGFERAQELVLAELELAAEEHAEREGLDRDAAAYLDQQIAGAAEKFDERGLPDCGGRVLDVAPGDVKEWLQVLGPNAFGRERFEGQPIPASMQFRLVLDEPVASLRLRVSEGEAYDPTRAPAGVPTRPDVRVLLKSADEPLAWAWDLPNGEHDADREADLVFAADGGATARFAGPLEAGVYHVQLANAGADWNLYELWFEVPSDDDDPADRAGGPSEPRAPAGCAATGGRPATPALLLLAVGLLARRRRTSG